MRNLAARLTAAGLALFGCVTVTPRPVAAATQSPFKVAGPVGADWPLPGLDYSNSRAAVRSPINASNIGKMTVAWQVATSGALTTAVVVVGDTVYAEDDHGVVVAVDAATGRTLWQSAPAGFTVGPEGVVVGWGLVFAATPNGVEALDQSTGRVVWTRELTTTPTSGVDIQPTLIGHEVLMATVPVSAAVQYHGGDRGELMAVDATSGRVDWTFDTVASPDLWGNPVVNSGGGAWYPPAFDPRSGLLYWGTANPAPFPGTAEYPNGSSRPGPNLYTDSTLALRPQTGKLVWFHQAVPHDLFDQDFVHALVVPVRGGGHRPTQVVVGTGKGGQVIGMNPSTGRALWTAAVGAHENHDLTALAGPTEVLPGTYGGVLTPPAAADGNVYLPVLNAPSVLSPDMTAYFGGKIGTMDGQLVAIDAATGQTRWSASVPGDPTGGATVVSNLVLTGTFQGQLIAVDRHTGKVVWTTNVGDGISGWPAAAGTLLVVPTGTVGTSGRLVAYRLSSS
jgi:outer membrane protein assembly factor BamB